MAYRIGIDAGSKTIKMVVLDENDRIVHLTYQRHHSNIYRTLVKILQNHISQHGNLKGTVAFTGSAGIAAAKITGLPFTQEVIATTSAVRQTFPQADAFIELGGEDAKVVYLTHRTEQRMNATCAGGTGGFIDNIAHMLGVRTSEMDRLARRAQQIYPIASRCAVFAETDVRPLLSAGARKEDLAASALEAVVRQTLGGLACGRPIRGTVVFLGGPFAYISELSKRFRSALDLTDKTGIRPQNAHLFTAMGAAIESAQIEGAGKGDERDEGSSLAKATPAAPSPAANLLTLQHLLDLIANAPDPEDDLPHLPPLFTNDQELRDFQQRHELSRMPVASMSSCKGPLYLGFDAGSTTIKYALINEEGQLVAQDYRHSRGNVLETALSLLTDLYHLMAGNRNAYLSQTAVVGYGDQMLRSALNLDHDVVETVAHLRAAQALRPDVSFVLDIGGQDVKALWVRDGRIVDAVLNEACSSGCGSFIEGSARALHCAPSLFASEAMRASNPLDLGTKCTVFMNSRVKHAQKIGAPREDIAAGIAYSVVQNTLFRVIGKGKVASMGDVVVVQGGTFKSDAVLRAFEKLTGIQAVRPNTAHLMGAIGAALVARDRAATLRKAAEDPRLPIVSDIVGFSEIDRLNPRYAGAQCDCCPNCCVLSLVSFGNGRVFVSGGKCPRGQQRGKELATLVDPSSVQSGEIPDQHELALAKAASAEDAPNVVAYEQEQITAFGTVPPSRFPWTVGLIGTLECYETLPFWHTLFADLGFGVRVASGAQSTAVKNASAESVPSESVCEAAKLSHARLFQLCQDGVDAVFLPLYERKSRCPVLCGYNNALLDSVEFLRDGSMHAISPQLLAFTPKKLKKSPEQLEELFRSCVELAQKATATGKDQGREMATAQLTRSDFDRAFARAKAAFDHFTAQVRAKTEEALEWVHAEPGRHGIVLGGRPYHIDPTLTHRIDEVIQDLGLAVLAPLGLTDRTSPISVQTGWKPSKHLLKLARFVTSDPCLDLVMLQSFGCGFDAVSLKVVQNELISAGHGFATLKIDEIEDTAHIRIRLRTMIESIQVPTTRTSKENGSAPSPRLGTCALPEFAEATAQDIVRALPLFTGPLDASVLETARAVSPPNICFTAAALIAQTVERIHQLEQEGISKAGEKGEGSESATPSKPLALSAPRVCQNCITDSLPSLVADALGAEHMPVIVWEHEETQQLRPPVSMDEPQADKDAPAAAGTATAAEPTGAAAAAVRVGIVGNPLLCFDPYMNEGLESLLREIGAEPVWPDPALLYVDDVRYLEQLDRFAQNGVDTVLYLQSFGCMKGHVQARGTAHAMAARWPHMPVTVLDYDPESSALNRENRIRLAVSAARLRQHRR